MTKRITPSELDAPNLDVTAPVTPSAEDPTPMSTVAECPTPHGLERTVTTSLLNHPSLKFSRLCVHQCGPGVIYLDGFLESNDGNTDVSEVVRGIAGVKQVVNRVLSPEPVRTVPKKG